MNVKPKNSEIIIDESKHTVAPSFFQRLRNSIIATVMGIVFAQVILFAFWGGLILFWWNNMLFISYLVACAILGWIVGDRFIETLVKKSDEWWGLWGYFRR